MQKELPTILELQPPSSYITEVVVTLQPVDFILSMTTLKRFYMILQPILEIPTPSNNLPVNKSEFLMHLNSQALPLAYLECRGLRVIMPSSELGSRGAMQDVFVFQIDRISLNPSAVNPICRTPCRPDIYQYAAQARILNIPGIICAINKMNYCNLKEIQNCPGPITCLLIFLVKNLGSEVEDRQYQLDVIGMSLNTGVWEELDVIFHSRAPLDAHLKIMNENPALEWNNLGKKHRNAPNLNLWPIINK